MFVNEFFHSRIIFDCHEGIFKLQVPKSSCSKLSKMCSFANLYKFWIKVHCEPDYYLPDIVTLYIAPWWCLFLQLWSCQFWVLHSVIWSSVIYAMDWLSYVGMQGRIQDLVRGGAKLTQFRRGHVCMAWHCFTNFS